MNALLPDTSVVLERTSAAVCVPNSTSSPSGALFTHTVFLPTIAPDYTCYRDSANTPRCRLYTSYTITRTYSTSTPTSSSSSPTPRPTPDSNDDDNDSDPPDNSDDNSNDDSSDSNSDNSDNSDSSNNNSTSSSSSSRPSQSGTAAGATSGAKNWKGSSTFFGLAPLLVLVGVCVL